MEENCVYLGEAEEGREANRGNQVHKCHLLESCTKEGFPKSLASCTHCNEKLLLSDEKFTDKYLDFLKFFDRNKERTHCQRNLLNGGAAFLVCGGPSAKELPLELLNQRGCWSLAVNNVAGWERFQPQAFVCADPPKKFCDGIWLDPKIMKIIPFPKLTDRSRGWLRRKRNYSIIIDCPDCKASGKVKKKIDGKKQWVTCGKCKGEKEVTSWFDRLEIGGDEFSTVDVPNVWGFERDAWLVPDDSFFLRDSAAWGNHDHGVKQTGQPKGVSTILCGLRLLYYLGARTIFLVGVDFWMDPTRDPEGNYSFGEHRDKGACKSNNQLFQVVGNWFQQLHDNGVFDRFGLSVYNTNPKSGLRTFQFVPFEEAVQYARRHLPEEPFDLSHWYTSE